MNPQFRFYAGSVLMISGLAAGLVRSMLAAGIVLLGLIIVAIILIRISERSVIRSLILPVIITVAAFLYGYWTEAANKPNIPEHLNGQEVTVQGRIVSSVKVDGDRVSFQFHVDEGSSSSFRVELDERIQTTIYLDTEAEQREAKSWHRGIELRIAGTLETPGTARNFGDFDYRSYLHKQRIHWQLTADGMQTIEMRSRPSVGLPLMLGYVDRFRDRLSELVWILYEERYAGFMQGLLIGDQNDLPQELYEDFSDIGMTHVLAISGLHVSVFTAGCFWLLKLLRLTREKTYAACFVLIPLYVLTTGASPSAVRAGLMAMLGLAALRMGRWKDSLRFIIIAAVLMLIWNPYFIYNVSFQLSFLVTFGLIVLVPRISAMLPIRSRYVNGALAVAIAAQASSFPIVIYYFHIVHALSPAANLLLVPLVSVLILPIGMLSLILGFIHEPIGHITAKLASYVTEGLFLAVEWTAGFESLLMSWPRLPLWWIAVYYVLLVALIVWIPGFIREYGERRYARSVLVVGCAAMITLLIYGYAGDHWNRTGIVSVLDVGQGDSILIRTPHGRHILVDGGGTIRFGEREAWRARRDPYEVGKDTIVPLLRRRGIHKLDAVVMTHQDADHIGGLHEVIERMPVDRILFNGTAKDSLYDDRISAAALERGIPMIPVSAGLIWQADDAATFRFLHPLRAEGLQEDRLVLEDDQNEASVVFLLTMHASSFLLTGDISMAEEKEIMDDLLVSAYGSEQIDVLKIAHHGSRYSTSEEWLRFWQPSVGAISVGRNNYGHPAPDVLERLTQQGVIIYRTDEYGEIQFRVDAGELYVRTKKT